MPAAAETTGARPSGDETAKYASLLATGERVLLVRQRHWLTFLEAGRWFVLALVAGIAVLLLDQGVPEDGFFGFLGSFLDWGFWLFLLIGLLGVGWYYLVWRVERYLVTTRRVIEAGGVINKYTRDTSLQMISDMVVGHPWLGRIVGYGEIDLLTGAEAGTSKIRFLPDADELQEGAARRQARVRARRRRRPRSAAGSRRPAGSATRQRRKRPPACPPTSSTPRSAGSRTCATEA